MCLPMSKEIKIVKPHDPSMMMNLCENLIIPQQTEPRQRGKSEKISMKN